MMEINKIDSHEVDNLLNVLDNDELRKNIIFKAIKAGAKVLQTTTKSYFKERMGASANHVSKYLKAPFYDGIIVKGDKAYCEARVSIMKDFRMKFFEKGTNERFIKHHSNVKRSRSKTGKSNYRGKINGRWFFKDARSASESAINEAIIKSIDNSLKRLEL